jgi:NTE family protein
VSGAGWFDSLDVELRGWLEASMEHRTLEGGATLFSAGDPADCLYLVKSGALGAYAADHPRLLLGQAVAGETVGERGLLTGRPRSATVRAIRDSELMRLPRPVFETLVQLQPRLALDLARLVVERAEQPARRNPGLGPRTLAVLPQAPGQDVDWVVDALERALAAFGPTTAVRRGAAVAPSPDFFSRLERDHQHVLYVASGQDDAWRQRCLRQADALLLVLDPDRELPPWAEARRGVPATLPRPEHLLVTHHRPFSPGDGRVWKALRPGAHLHHLYGPGDLPRVARLIEGRASTLVLSGGGARGFAHLGVLRALQEAKVPIDAVGGTSIGAIIGAGLAAGWELETMTAVFRDRFVHANPLSDYTLPLVSMVSGHRVTRLLQETFGELGFEDLLRPFFCVSANLTLGRLAVHTNGRVWKWLRASSAIPGVLPPVFHRGHVHVDGGVMNNLPVEVMREFQAGEVIAVDIGADGAIHAPLQLKEFELPALWRVVLDWFRGTRRPSVFSLMLGSGVVNALATTSAARASATLLLRPPVQSVELLQWERFDEVVQLGYEYAARALEAR